MVSTTDSSRYWEKIGTRACKRRSSTVQFKIDQQNSEPKSRPQRRSRIIAADGAFTRRHGRKVPQFPAYIMSIQSKRRGCGISKPTQSEAVRMKCGTKGNLVSARWTPDLKTACADVNAKSKPGFLESLTMSKFSQGRMRTHLTAIIH